MQPAVIQFLEYVCECVAVLQANPTTCKLGVNPTDLGRICREITDTLQIVHPIQP